MDRCRQTFFRQYARNDIPRACLFAGRISEKRKLLMDLRQLRYFAAVVEEGTISAAARKLNISQPPLSLQIRMLEDEYGLRLFERGARQITLTDAGRMFYRYAAEILELQHAADTDMHDLRAGKRGSVRIGLVSSFYSGKMYAALKTFYRKYPQVQFQVSEGNTYQLIEHLHNGRIELAVIRTPYQDRALDRIVLEEDRIVAAGKPKLISELQPAGMHPESISELQPAGMHPDRASGLGPQPGEKSRKLPEGSLQYVRRCREVHLRDLGSRPLILYRRWEKILRSGFEREKIDPDILCIADDARTALTWADEGLGIALVPKSAMHQSPQLACAYIAEESMLTDLCLVRLHGSPLSQSAELFLQEVMKQTSSTNSASQIPRIPA